MKYDRTDPDWRWGNEARCKDVDVELFFPPRDKEKYKIIASEAKSYCLGKNGKNPCPVQKYCLWDAVSRDELHGIWGGMSHRERNAVVRRWQRQYSDTMTLKEYIFSEGV